MPKIEPKVAMYFYRDLPPIRDTAATLKAALAQHNNRTIRDAVKTLQGTDGLPEKDKRRVDAAILELQLIAGGLLDV